MVWTDSHIHLTAFGAEDIVQYLENCRALGVRQFFLAGYSPTDATRQIELIGRLKAEGSDASSLRTSIGLHPWFLQDTSGVDAAWEQVQNQAKSFDFIGETGLDFFRAQDEQMRALQKKIFIKHLELAAQLQKPLVLHVVQAHSDALEILKDADKNARRGLVHGFSGSYEIAKQYIDLGFLISIGPGLLAPEEAYGKLKLAVSRLSLETLLIETDADGDKKDLRPELLLQIAAKLAEMKGLSLEKVNATLTANAQRLMKKA